MSSTRLSAQITSHLFAVQQAMIVNASQSGRAVLHIVLPRIVTFGGPALPTGAVGDAPAWT